MKILYMQVFSECYYSLSVLLERLLMLMVPHASNQLEEYLQTPPGI